ncbi:response regulator transcription factor [Acetobacter sp. TBRC 12305]|uniref:Response regulator transcription factor n=2 Tax=Acetobacter garciniae TaxID=2817435 RepID=A0A939HI00_9PROT|nr:response regulator transcription factor [Acetobacter garciniae]MBX0344446.1 response regulator transcription factor [Acetobacter garciniae]
MRILCIGDTSTQGDGRPCSGLSRAALDGTISITMSGPEGVAETLRRSHYDLAVIQQAAPDSRLVRHIRKSRVPTPLLIIARTLTATTVADVLSAGADDCVPISVEPVELLARLRAIVRRVSGHDSLTLQIGRLSVSPERRVAHIDGKLVPLTRREYELVQLLALRKGQVLNKETLLDSLYGGESEPHGKVIDVMICKIRKKIREFGIDEPFTTLWGIGYRLNEEAFIPLGAKMSSAENAGNRPSRESCIPVTSGINILASSNALDLA